MDPIYSKAQRQMGGSSFKASTKGSARKARMKKKRASKTQNAGQPSGPGGSISTAERSKSRTDVERDEETQRVGGGESAGSKVASYTVGALHAVDIGLGLALVVYGGMVHVSSVTAAAICYGLVLFLGAIAGAIGYYSGACNRRGLRGSAIAGFLACLLDIGAFIAVIAAWDPFIQFLNDNHEALMLSTDSIETIQGLKILFAVIFIVLAGLEVHRGLAMWDMKDTMAEEGATSRVTPLSRSTSDSKPNWFLSLFGLAKRKKTDDFVMFDDNASMESSLLWSKNGAQPTSDDYLEFVPEHERGLANFHSTIGLPTPPEDRMDY
mmetsp:Transcript_8619/g.19372  ORF Transcript_8619/g.19372 Transcript_8619/m.19372 type:complete len:323 (-) Transcript_8619:87-1055(-)|eukprot:CAMPEP_0172310830 /NCGR_PEP_ID=MMETSP1058-20130122/12720_1 /TAXON_ID=83371 /ORGANISM="Detonula confervacea, Strain CCMP 353" /LENGTH=322 /DNA_ID=CAMNT_0013023785 /DNA_START=165 /DNA_END=1133 /DNA_ORIENTATION=-